MNSDDTSTLHVVAGPNGSGKSTLTEAGLFGATEVIDPDAIARGLAPDDPSSVAISAGKEALNRQSAALDEGRSFVVETTLAGNGPLRLMDEAAANGFDVELHYIRIEDPRVNIERVEDRVARGGHDVPPEDIVRRYDRSHDNLPAAIAKADRATLYDNGGDRLEIKATVSRGEAAFTMDAPQWATQAVRDAAYLRYENASTGNERTEALGQLTDSAEASKTITGDEAEKLHERIDAEQTRLNRLMSGPDRTEFMARDREDGDHSL